MYEFFRNGQIFWDKSYQKTKKQMDLLISVMTALIVCILPIKDETGVQIALQSLQNIPKKPSVCCAVSFPD